MGNLQCISSHSSSSSRLCQGLTTSRLSNSQPGSSQGDLSSQHSSLPLEGKMHITSQHLYNSSPTSQPPNSRLSSQDPSPSRSSLHSSSSSSLPIPGLNTKLTQMSIFMRQTTTHRGLTHTAPTYQAQAKGESYSYQASY